MLTLRASVKTPTVLVKRDVFEGSGRFSEDPRLVLGEDYELYLRFALRSPVIAVPEVLARIREHKGRTTAREHDPYQLKPLIYELFIASGPDAINARLARRLRASSLAEAAAHQLSAGKLGLAARMFARSAMQGADVRDWTRALARGIRDRMVRQRKSAA